MSYRNVENKAKSSRCTNIRREITAWIKFRDIEMRAHQGNLKYWVDDRRNNPAELERLKGLSSCLIFWIFEFGLNIRPVDNGQTKLFLFSLKLMV